MDRASEWVDFELGEDARDERRLRQDQEWAGAVADGRGHVSNREQAMLNAPQLSLAISDYGLIEELVSALDSKTSILRKISPETLRLIIDYVFPDHGTLVTSSVIRRKLAPLMEIERAYSNSNGNEFPFRICIRKRPLMSYEEDFGAYDVCTADTRNGLTLHEGRLARNGRQLSMTHHQFVVDRVYDEETDNQHVCLDAVEPLLSWAESGFTSTLLCFGQTGTGKTYTLYGALEYISTRLVGKSIRITFYEVHGKKCYDLLRDRNIVHLRSDSQDNMHVRGAHSVELCPLREPAELIAVLKDALALRSSKVTERNPISSRSHAVCTIELLVPAGTHSATSAHTAMDKSLGTFLANNPTSVRKNNTSSESDSVVSTEVGAATSAASASHMLVQGKITLVDLAGSERNYETTQMTAAQHKESADINFALMALKDCFRAYNAQLTSHLQSLENRLQEKLSKVPEAVPSLFHAPPTSLVLSKPFTMSVDKLESKLSDGAGTAGGSAQMRIPFRSSTLTKVLKECFTSGPLHRTTIMTTISPTPVDLQHSLHTLNHVVLMCPELQQLVHRVTVEVPLNMHLQLQNRFNAKLMHSTAVGTGLSLKPVPAWTSEDVIAWLASAERGRFKHVVLPPGIDGEGLLMLSATNIVDLFAAQAQNSARVEKEGSVWVETVEDTRRVRALGRALWRALRREMQSIIAREAQVNQMKK
eukprot:CAMPEP_0170386448 /NCGR_PEP_ID=MMETSP0117_2-20130122/17038_1 /TAXON_ID=400756 /ORGANISM="Durinskia baltica, Strain CSIRO CS-38" /LENGTH=703 /DNA_ID=CAMNT_0010642267 /DNA_START=64 /DNA_END=2176 /DNA_ORIENTATION=-